MFTRLAFFVLFVFGLSGLSAQSDQAAHAPPVQQGYRIAGVLVN